MFPSHVSLSHSSVWSLTRPSRSENSCLCVWVSCDRILGLVFSSFHGLCADHKTCFIAFKETFCLWHSSCLSSQCSLHYLMQELFNSILLLTKISNILNATQMSDMLPQQAPFLLPAQFRENVNNCTAPTPWEQWTQHTTTSDVVLMANGPRMTYLQIPAFMYLFWH